VIEFCQVCSVNKGDKKNCHVIPKFLAIEMLGDKHSREGYEYSNKAIKRGRKLQDLPKEDYLCCTNCEKKFNTIETIFASKSKKPSVELFERNYTLKNGILHPTFLTTKEIQLFFYSIFIRLHLSCHKGYERFKLPNDVFEKIRSSLSLNLSPNLSETRALLLNEIKVNNYPMLIFTSDYKLDLTKCLLTINYSTELKNVFLLAGEWVVLMSTVEDIPYAGAVGKKNVFAGEKPVFHYSNNIEFLLAVRDYYEIIIKRNN